MAAAPFVVTNVPCRWRRATVTHMACDPTPLHHDDAQTLLAYSRRHDGEHRFLDLARHAYGFTVQTDNVTAEGAVDPAAPTYCL
eukprot:1555075-Rhodomonas_salina.2